MNFSTKDYVRMSRMRISAFIEIAEKLGKDHPITKMMGALEWGRHSCERGPDGGLREAIDPKAQKIMLDLYPTGYSTVKP